VTSGRLARAGRLVLCAASVGLLASCGGSAGDLIALEVSGGFESQAVRLTVTDDGRGRCGDGGLEPISNERLIEAREVERDIEELAEEGARFADREGPAGRHYVASTRAGTVRWAEGAPALPEVLPRAALLAEELQDDLCR
jgi:hypothetical protein